MITYPYQPKILISLGNNYQMKKEFEFMIAGYSILARNSKSIPAGDWNTVLRITPHKSEDRVKFKHFSNLAVPVELVIELMRKSKTGNF